MKTCIFFGHRDCPDALMPLIRDAVAECIRMGVTGFYVGNKGKFDRMVQHALFEAKKKYPHILCAVVLHKMPLGEKFLLPTLLPEGVETVLQRFAISFCNTWMLKKANCVVTYVVHAWGGAAKFAELAKKQKKYILELGAI